MKQKYNILILGASYGSLLGSKMAFAGHDVHLVCLPNEANAINIDGVKISKGLTLHCDVTLTNEGSTARSVGVTTSSLRSRSCRARRATASRLAGICRPMICIRRFRAERG